MRKFAFTSSMLVATLLPTLALANETSVVDVSAPVGLALFGLIALLAAPRKKK